MTEQISSQPAGTTWFVGASFGHTDDQSTRFLQEGIWEISSPSQKEQALVRSMRPGERIAIKAQYCSDTKFRRWLMRQMERCTAMPDAEVADFALDAARVQAPAAARATPERDLGQYGLMPGRQALRGEWPQLAASCA